VHKAAVAVVACLLLSTAPGWATDEAKQHSSRSGRMLFPAALLEASEKSQLPLLAEVGTWMGRWSVRSPDSKSAAQGKLPEDLLRRTDYRSWEFDGWTLARSRKWFSLSQRDCDLALIRRIDEEGGITPSTALAVVTLSPQHNNTLRAWLSAVLGGYAPRCPELKKLLEDPRSLAGLSFWAWLTPVQVDRALRSGLWVEDLAAPQVESLCTVIDEAAGLACTPELLRGGLVRLSIAGPGEFTAEAKEEYLSQIGQLPAPADASPGDLIPEGEVRLIIDLPSQSEPISVRLPIVGPEERARRLEETPLLDRFKIGKITTLWPEKEERSGLETPFTMWANMVSVKDVLLAITRECGVHLKADKHTGRRYLVANFKKKTVDDFRKALGELLDCKWRYDKEGEYWLLYEPEDKRKQAERLMAQEEAQRKREYLESETYERRKPVWEAVLRELGAETERRIAEGHVVRVPIARLSLEVQQQVVDMAYRSHLRDPSEEMPKAEQLAGGWLEFRPRGGVPGGEVLIILDFWGSDSPIGYMRTTLKGSIF